MLLFSTCEKEGPVESVQTFVPEISNLIVPDTVFSLSSLRHVISVRVVDPQGIEDIGSVDYRIAKDQTTTPLYVGALVDDGSSGDIIPDDGVFAFQLESDFARGDSGAYNMEVSAVDKDGHESDRLVARIVVKVAQLNAPIGLSRVSGPASVFIDPAFEFLITAEPLADLASIGKVVYQLYPPSEPGPTVSGVLLDDGLEGDETANDGTFSALLSSALIRKTADHSIRLHAEDRAGNLGLPRVLFIRGRPERTQEPVLSNAMVPELVVVSLPVEDIEITLSVAVSDPQGNNDIDYVRVNIFTPEGRLSPESPLQLFDDGNIVESGDITTDDGIYTLKYVLAANEVTEGQYRFEFQAKDSGFFFSNRFEDILPVTFSAAPVVFNMNVADSVIINNRQDSEITITVEAADAQGTEDIAKVQLELFGPGGQGVPDNPLLMLDDGDAQNSGDLAGDDGIFSAKYLFAANEVEAGLYRLQVQATDRSDLASEVLEQNLTVHFNDAPFLFTIDVPDTLQINPLEDTPIPIMATVFDPQGPEDIVLVQFRSFLPNGNEAQESPFQLLDDGEGDDLVANDGVFTLVIFLPSQGVTPGAFRFVFQATDRFGLKSNTLEHVLTVIQ